MEPGDLERRFSELNGHNYNNHNQQASHLFGVGMMDQTSPLSPQCNRESSSRTNQEIDNDVQITCFTEDLHDATLHFQIIRLKKQIYVWIGCNSAKFGHLYAAAPTRPNNMVSVTSLLGGGSDNKGSSIAHRLVLKTGLNIVLACNIPKDSPMLEANAERKLVEKLSSLGYIRPKSEGFSSTSTFP